MIRLLFLSRFAQRVGGKFWLTLVPIVLSLITRKEGWIINMAVGRYVLMLDHIHFFVAGDHEFDLGMWVRGLKRIVAAAVTGGRDGKHPAAETAAATSFSPLGKLQPFWQRGFFDHLIHNTESYAQKCDYVRENPVRAGLVSTREGWPFQGEIVEIKHP